MHRFEKTIYLPCPVDVAFNFHTCMDNICRIVPNNISIKILSAPCSINLGDTVRLMVSMHFFPFYWEAIITEFEQNKGFADTLKHGPFSFWLHQHRFKAENQGTVMTDLIEYKVGFAVLGKLASRFFVQSELERIFKTRHEKAVNYFNNKML
jgi:ligand-binding SRPBCC domain-containing protein